jgi:hypothetical protein
MQWTHGGRRRTLPSAAEAEGRGGTYLGMAIVAHSRMAAGVGYPRSGAVSDASYATPLFLYFLAVILPSELAINLFGMALIPVRVVLIAIFVPAVLRLARDNIARF